MNSFRTCLLVMAIMICGSCAAEKRAAVPRAVAKAGQAANEPVIVKLVSRHQTITITAGHGGALYTVVDASGKTIITRATLDELRVSDSEIYRMVAPGAMVWAGM